MSEAEVASHPFFESKKAEGRVAYRLFAISVFAGICLIWIQRLVFMPRVEEQGRWVWFGMLVAELCFGFYWICTQAVRWSVAFHQPFKRRLLQRYKDNLPRVDIFVCTADPMIEPPILVMNTVLAAASYNYPTEKLAVYLSDDGGSELTFYAMLEAAEFAKYWVPFCKRYNIKPLSPEAYFAQSSNVQDITFAQELSLVKKLYNEMKDRINSTVERGIVPKNIRDQHKGFLEWNNNITKKDHQAIVQIVVDGRDGTNVENNGCQMPTLVYLAREKNSQYPHHFKAGAMNALIRVSSIISNGSIILNLDCDMYANEPDTILEALCFFMDEKKGHEIAFVQHSQAFNNITKNDLYGNSYNVIHKVELNGMGGYGASPYCGTGCFHRRETLCGKKFSMDKKLELKIETKMKEERTGNEVEEAAKLVASCRYEQDTQWGKEMGLVYGCSVEDMITGLTIQCRGWKSIYYSPKRDAFLGIAPTTLEVHLIQHKRWSEGMFQIFLSKYCPFIYGYGKLKLGAKLGYCVYLLWPPLSLPTLYYVIVPPLCLLRGIPLFPQVSLSLKL